MLLMPNQIQKHFVSVDTNENSLGSTDSISGSVPTNFSSLSNDTLRLFSY